MGHETDFIHDPLAPPTGFNARAERFGGGAQGAGVGGSGGSGVLLKAARLAASQPGLSFSEFKAAIGEGDETELKNSFDIYRQLLSPTGARSGEGDTPTSPEPEGPGRFQATRPGDLLPGGSSSLRFGS